MSLAVWGAGLLRRFLLFLVGAILITFLLHVPLALVPASHSGGAPAFSAERWLSSSADYLGQLLRGEPGILRRLGPPGFREDQPVGPVLARQIPRSLYLMALALIFATVVGTVLGLAASRFGAWHFRGMALSLTLLMLSAPDVLLAAMLRRVAIWGMENLGLRLLDPMTLEITWSDALFPALALGALPVALVARTAAVAFDEVYIQLYIRTAVAKGLTAWEVIWKHALKNAWIRVADVGPLIVGSLVTGMVVVELLFYYPGIGRTLGLILERGIQPQAATVISLVLMAAALLVEWSLATLRLWLDPRLQGQSEGWRLPRFRLPTRAPKATVAQPKAPGFSLREILGETLTHLAWFLRPSRMLAELWRNPALLIGLLGIAALFYLAIFGGMLADLRATAFMPKYLIHQEEIFFPPYRPGMPNHPLGSDVNGRDMLARILMGARYTIFFTLAVTPVRFLIALPWGLLAGFKGAGWAAVSRTLSLVASAVPMVLVPAALFPLRGLLGGDPLSDSAFWLITLILALGGVPRLVESVRLQVEAVLVQPFLEGARAVGAPPARILMRHVGPHLAPQLWVTAATDMAWTLLLLAQLGVFSIFVGGSSWDTAYGAGTSMIPIARVPDWSSMLAKPYEVLHRAPWALWFPALAFLLAIVAFNLTAEGLRKRLQSFAATPSLPEVETLPDGRQRMVRPVARRLALEWIALVLVCSLGGGGLALAHSGLGAEPLSPLEQARADVHPAVQTIFGTGETRTRIEAVTELEMVVTRFLREAYRAKWTSTQVQQELIGRANLFAPQGGPLVLEIHLPQTLRGVVPEHSHLFIQEPSDGKVYYFKGDAKPAMAGAPPGRLLLAGTVPATGRYTLSAWVRSNSAWGRDEAGAKQLLAAIPDFYKPRLSAPNQVELGVGSIQVDQSGGQITLCKPENKGCESISLAW